MSLDLTGIRITGSFNQTHSCGKTLAAGASCTVQATFTPEAPGSVNGSLSFTDNAPGSPQTVALTGVGTIVKLNPSSLDFGAIVVGRGFRKSLTTTLTNIGSVTVNISSISITGDTTDFSQTNTCGATVAPETSCVITVTFFPQREIGQKHADVSVTDNGGGSPQVVFLTGVGTICLHDCPGT